MRLRAPVAPAPALVPCRAFPTAPSRRPHPRRDRTPDDPAYPASESDRCHHRYRPRRDAVDEGAATATRPANGPCLAAEGEQAKPKTSLSPRMILRATHGPDHRSATRRRGGGARCCGRTGSRRIRGRRRRPAPAGAPGPPNRWPTPAYTPRSWWSTPPPPTDTAPHLHPSPSAPCIPTRHPMVPAIMGVGQFAHRPDSAAQFGS